MPEFARLPEPRPAVFAPGHPADPRVRAEACFVWAKKALNDGDYDLSLRLLNQAEALAGPLPQLLATQVNVLRQARAWMEALRRCQQLLELHPNSTDAHLALGFILLLQGRWLEGWREREWRWQHPGFRSLLPRLLPVWDGGRQPGRRLWVQCEQGFGDFLQFCRLLPEVASRVGSLVVTVPKALQALAQASFPQIEFQADASASPSADAWVSLMSLPDRLGWIPPEIPPVPYLHVAGTNPLRRYVEKKPVRRLGWVSAGNPDHFNDRNRSLNANALDGFELPPTVTAFRVQPDTRLVDQLPFRLEDPEFDLSDFSATARWLSTLDLVITVDTSVAHLAGGLGIPVWILLPYAPDWRWGVEGEQTRWYGSARLFRQPRPNDWNSVLKAVARELHPIAA